MKTVFFQYCASVWRFGGVELSGHLYVEGVLSGVGACVMMLGGGCSDIVGAALFLCNPALLVSE